MIRTDHCTVLCERPPSVKFHPNKCPERPTTLSRCLRYLEIIWRVSHSLSKQKNCRMRHTVENSGPVISVKGLSRLGWSPSDNGQIRPAMTTCWKQKVANGPMSKYSERSQSVKIRGEKAGHNTQCNDILRWCG